MVEGIDVTKLRYYHSLRLFLPTQIHRACVFAGNA